MKNLKRTYGPAILAFCLVLNACGHENGGNLSFDDGRTYFKNNGNYESGNRDGVIYIRNLNHDKSDFGVFTADMDNYFDLAGRTVEYRGKIKTNGVTEGYAGLWMRVDGETRAVRFDNMNDRGVTGDSGWTEASIILDIPENYERINFGGLLTGNGSAWYKDLEIIPLDDKGELEGYEAVEPTPEEVAWLRQYVHPLRTCKADGGPDDDLSVLGGMIGDASVVGLGEVTHGSGEIFMMKHRIVKYLRENKGFDIFSIEASMPDAYNVDKYVSRGEGDPADLIRGMIFWTWRTQEVLDMVWWMHDHNATSPDKIRFTGFDMQSYVTPLAEVAGGLYGIAGTEEKLDELEDLFKKVRDRMRKGEVESPVDAARITNLLTEIGRLVGDSGGPQKEWLSRMVRVLEQCAGDQSLRDACMAENALWIKETNPGSKIAIWAHNAHIQKSHSMMGQYLAEELGDDYVTVGFAFHKGSYTAVGPDGLGTYTAEDSGPGSFEYYFHLMDEPIFAIDLRRAAADDSPEGEWLRKKLNFRQVGAVAGNNEFSNARIVDMFDILIFIDETLQSVLLPAK